MPMYAFRPPSDYLSIKIVSITNSLSISPSIGPLPIFLLPYEYPSSFILEITSTEPICGEVQNGLVGPAPSEAEGREAVVVAVCFVERLASGRIRVFRAFGSKPPSLGAQQHQRRNMLVT